MNFNDYAEKHFKYDEELKMNVLVLNRSCKQENCVVVYAHNSIPNKILLGVNIKNAWRPLTFNTLISNPFGELSVAKVEFIKFINKLKKEMVIYEL